MSKLAWPFNEILPLVYNDALSFDENIKELINKCNEVIDNAENVPDFVYQLLQEYVTNMVTALTYDEDKRAIVVDETLTILKQPTETTVQGEALTVNIYAYVAGATSYQWQYSADGESWFSCTEEGANTYKLTLISSSDKNEWLYRLRVNNRMRVAYTNPVHVKVA